MRIGAKKSPEEKDLSLSTSKDNQLHPVKGFFWEARTRILACYGVLMTGFILVSVPIFSELVFRQVDSRVREDLIETLESFQTFVADQTTITEQLTSKQLEKVFTEFLSRQITEDDTFIITILDGKYFRSSSKARPAILHEDRKLIRYWAKLTTRQQGELETGDPNLGKLVYLATPIITKEEVQGVFVIVHLTAGERREAQDVILTVIKVLFIGLELSLILAWLASGKVLQPMRSLATTARAISESNLQQRIAVQSSGEMGELARTFNKMLDRLQNSFNTQKAFINDLGHELRTPIAIIRGHLELMGDDPQEQQETIEIAFDELDRMTRMVEDLLLLVKSERPDFLNLEKLDLGLLTQEFYNKATALAERNWKLDAQATKLIVGDRQRLTQAIMNLAENATHYTTESDTIAIGSMCNSKEFRIWVRDSGIGIANEEQNLIFQRFARGSNTSRRSEGSGLGLSIVQAIAEAHGGRVELVSQLDVGSTFTLVLPLKISQQTLGGSKS